MPLVEPKHNSLAELAADPNFTPVFNLPKKKWSRDEYYILDVAEKEADLGDMTGKESSKQLCVPPLPQPMLRPSLLTTALAPSLQG